MAGGKESTEYASATHHICCFHHHLMVCILLSGQGSRAHLLTAFTPLLPTMRMSAHTRRTSLQMASRSSPTDTFHPQFSCHTQKGVGRLFDLCSYRPQDKWKDRRCGSKYGEESDDSRCSNVFDQVGHYRELVWQHIEYRAP